LDEELEAEVVTKIIQKRVETQEFYEEVSEDELGDEEKDGDNMLVRTYTDTLQEVPIGVTEEELDQQIHPLMQTVQTHD
jgi:uncharacterized protein YqeY